MKEVIWNNNNRSTISQDILCAPIDQGEKSLLHLEAHSEAIELNWLKELINQSNPWTHFSNALIAKCVRLNPKVNPKAQQKYFSQSWEYTYKQLPLGLQQIMKVKKKYHIQIEALAIHQDMKICPYGSMLLQATTSSPLITITTLHVSGITMRYKQ
jgi:hypothetical protein